MEIDDIYSELVMEHSQNSPYKKDIKNPTCSVHGHNPNCGDDITLSFVIENGIIKDVSFTGQGCAISQSSTSIMIETLIGKTIKEAQKIIDIFIDLIDRKQVSKEDKKLLKNAQIFKNISNMPARVKCALLAWKTTKNILNEQN
ncbi:MAG: SUF system NifU family Fe-S cluster assembly protein [Clostridia bacterium]|nr:SUF system NifU family Fe-S cluster assembly protein [Clostridia bacterium]